MTLGKTIQEKPDKKDSPSKSLPKDTTPEIFGNIKKDKEERKEENNRFSEFDDLDEDEERDDLERDSDGGVIASSQGTTDAAVDQNTSWSKTKTNEK